MPSHPRVEAESRLAPEGVAIERQKLVVIMSEQGEKERVFLPNAKGHLLPLFDSIHH